MLVVAKKPLDRLAGSKSIGKRTERIGWLDESKGLLHIQQQTVRFLEPSLSASA